MFRRRTAFTMVELMIVIAVLVVLIGMAVYGLGVVLKSGQEKDTRALFHVAHGMLDELNLAGQGAAALKVLYPNNLPIRAPGLVKAETYVPDPPPPGLIAQPDRYSSDAVIQTQLLMQKLRSIPNNRAAMEKLPPEKVLGRLPAEHLKPKPPARLLADKDTGYINPPLLLDNWGNPIIYVPAAGMAGVRLKDNPSAARLVTSVGVFPDSGEPYPGQPGARGFFASAGPDGIFGFADENGDGSFDPNRDVPGGDDNIYSFEN